MLETHVCDRGTPGPHLLITGGVHGDELEPPIAIRRLIELPDLARLRGRLTLVPVVNIAAFALGHREAEDGLDLARTCPGAPDGSITQRAAYALSQLIRAADYYIDLHTGGKNLSVWPLTGYMLHPSANVLDKQRGMAQAFNLPVIWGTDPNLHGRSLSVARDANVPAIYAEYEGGGHCSEIGVKAYVAGCLNVMAHLRMLVRPALKSNVQFSVEDPRPNSGHMQCCYPAPVSGLFEPHLALGHPVSAGGSIGVIVDSRHVEHQVFASQTGRVLVLRRRMTVKAGDSLAVILEVPTAVLVS